MDGGVRALYINLLGFKLSPKEMFRDWNIYKHAAQSVNHKPVKLYPKYIMMAMKYEAK